MSNASVMIVGESVMAYIDGLPYQKTIENKEERYNLYEEILHADISKEKTKKKILSYFKPPLTEEEVEQEKLYEKVKVETEMVDWLKEQTLFPAEVQNDRVYLMGLPISAPIFVIRELYKRFIKNEDYQAVLNFWLLCAANPDPVARNDVFEFLMGGGFTITPSGHFIAYRNVEIFKEGDVELTKFVSDTFIHMKKKKWSVTGNVIIHNSEKSERFKVIDHMDYSLNAEELSKDGWIHLGSVYDVYHSLAKGDNATIYTDAYSGTFRIRIGEVVKMERKDCNKNPKDDCSYGLHVGNRSFLGRGYFGGQGIIVLIDPSKVVAVPKYNPNKMRVCEYFPVGLAEYDKKGKVKEINTSVFEYEYSSYNFEKLQAVLASSDLKEHKVNLVVPEDYDITSFRKYIATMEEMRNAIKGRIIKVH